jgi:hypothetical protein
MAIQSLPSVASPHARSSVCTHSLTHSLTESNRTRHFPSQRFAEAGDRRSLGILGP